MRRNIRSGSHGRLAPAAHEGRSVDIGDRCRRPAEPFAKPGHGIHRLAIVAGLVALGAMSSQAEARRKPGTHLDSGYGVPGQSEFWQLSRSARIVNGINIATQIVCPGGRASSEQCSDSYVFLYQIPTGPSNLVLTFDELAGFAFDGSGFGVLLCDYNFQIRDMLCTKHSTRDDIDHLNLEFNASAGRLVIFIPAVPEGDTLTFYLRETPRSTLFKLAPPVFTIGHAIVTPSTLRFGSQEAGTPGMVQPILVTSWPSPSSRLIVTQTKVDSPFAVTQGCGSIDPGQSCAVQARFVPRTGEPSDVTGTFAFLNGLDVVATLPVVGHATSPGVTVSPSVLTFGNQRLDTASQPRIVTLSHSPLAAGPLTIFEIAVAPNKLTDLADFVIVEDGCTGTLNAGQSCQIEVSFAPQFQGALSSTLIVSDDAPGGVHKVMLTGLANSPDSPTTSTSSLSFDSQVVGLSSREQTITLTRPSAGTRIVAVDATPPFSVIRETCTNADPLTSCSADIAFAPSFAGSVTGVVTFASNAIDETTVVPVSGVGTDFSLSLSPASATVSRGSTATYKLTVASEFGFAGPVTASCSRAPSGVTCNASPSSAMLAAAGSLAIDVTVTTRSSSKTTATGGIDHAPWWGGFVLLVACGVLLVRRWSSGPGTRALDVRRAMQRFAFVALTCGGMSSCGSNSSDGTQDADPGDASPGDTDSETPTGSFTLDLQIASGTLVHSATATLIVLP